MAHPDPEGIKGCSRWSSKSTPVVSPYFFAVDLPTRRLLWKRPMVGTTPVAVSGKFAVIESHGDWGIYGASIHKLPSQIILIDPVDGRTLTKIGPQFRPKDDGNHPVKLLSAGDTFCFANGEAVTAYHVR